MSPTGSGLTVKPFHLRPRPADELAALFAGGWPAFIQADALAARHLPTERATFAGVVQQWQEWSGLDLPGDGAYVIPDALAPLHVDRAADLGTCTEPTIWVQHR